MGRKTDYKERPKPGPGRKTKKQGEPTFSAELSLKAADPNKKLSSHQKKRLKKREQKKEDRVKKVKPVKVVEEEEEEESDEGIDGDDVNEEELDSDTEDLGITEEFTDENAAWLKPSNKRKLLEDSDSDEEPEFDQDEPDFDDEEGADDDEEDDNDEEDDDDSDDDDMKVEKASKKLQSKQSKMWAEGEEEMEQG